MNPGYWSVIAAEDEERRNLFLTTATRMGTAVQNVEKDFWVCWTLDVLFHGLGNDVPRLLFRGGTSLSKAFGLISRFSEDIDITVFRGDLGQSASIEELEALSGKKRRARLDAIRNACQGFIGGQLLDRFSATLEDALGSVRSGSERSWLELDPHDHDRQTLLFWYPAVTHVSTDYVRSAVKIEAGAKSALDPNVAATVTPYVAADLGDIDLRVTGITTVRAERTFWDKVIILHGVRRWHERRGELRHGGQRVSRHYYDVFRLLNSPIGTATRADISLAVDCARHARMFFNSPDLDLEHAAPGTFALAPTPPMLDTLRRDYAAMAGMVFGDVPAFDDVIVAIGELERQVNK